MVTNITYSNNYKTFSIVTYKMMLLSNNLILHLANAVTLVNGNARRFGQTGGLLKSIDFASGGVLSRN
jgi:hypothetical protein